MYDSINMYDEHHTRRQNDHETNDFFFNQLPRYIYIHTTKKEVSGTLYFDDMNERSEYENERRRKNK